MFHWRIAEAADNRPLRRSVTELFDKRNKPWFEQLGRHFETAPTWRLALADAAEVIAAITTGQPDAARAAMHAHLQKSHDRFAGSGPQAAQDHPPQRTPAESSTHLTPRTR